MKHLFFFILALIGFSTVQAQEDILATWLKSDEPVDGTYLNVKASVSVYMELSPEDIFNFNEQGKNLKTLKQVQFYLKSTELIQNVKISIRQGISLASSTETYTQIVDNLTVGWNMVDLTTAYTIEPSQSLYVGFEITPSLDATYSLPIASGTESRQAWLYDGDAVNIGSENAQFLIKALVSATPTPANELVLLSLSVAASTVVNTNVNVVGIVRNIGTGNLNSFTVEYKINDGTPVSHTFTGLNVASYKTYNFAVPTPFQVAEPGTVRLEVTISKPNGEDDYTYNNTKSQDLIVNATNEVALNALTLPAYRLLNEESEIKFAVRNMGSESITSLTVDYRVNGGEPVSHTFENLNIGANRTVNLTHPVKLLASPAETQSVVVTLSNPNGRPDAGYNNSKSADILVYARAVQRTVLHENFTSSTCGPCSQGNAYLQQNIRPNIDDKDWVHISYQMSWPGSGDPYYTLEGEVRRSLYGINSAPHMNVDGNRYANSPIYYTLKSHYNVFRAIPSGVKMAGAVDVNAANRTVSANITVLPATTMNTQDYRLFAAILERRTTKNVKSNGETEFFNVFKKFLTSPSGDALDDFVLNVAKTYSLSYTFNGNYRLPNNAGDPINHAIEHSVENFDNLFVVWWIQNMKTKEVTQAGKTGDGVIISIPKVNSDANALAYIHDGFLNIHSAAPVENIELYNISGQKQILGTMIENTIPVHHLSSGVYVLKIKTAEGERNIKVIK